MKKIYVTYFQEGKIKKAVLDESLYNNYLKNSSIKNITTYENEKLLEVAYATEINKKNILLG